LNPALDVSQYAHTAWKVREGFTKGPITAITQTPDGYLWLGTEFGLYRFDGVRNIPWEPPPNQHLPSNEIGSLLTARDGTLWIGTDEGLASWSNGKITPFVQLAGTFVFSLIEDQEGVIWAGAMSVPTGRLCAIRKGSVRCFGEDGSLGRGVLSLYEHRGAIWVGAGTGLWRWKPDPPRLYPMPVPIPDIPAVIEGDNGALWFAMNAGIRQLINGRLERYPLPVGGQFRATRFLRDRDGGLWIGTSGQGLLHLHQRGSDVFAVEDGLSGDRIRSLFEDREGTIWVATFEGLDRFRDFAVPTVSIKQGLSSVNVGSVLAARDGAVWIGTSNGLNRWTDEQITSYRKPNARSISRPARQPAAREINDSGLPDNGSQSLLEDSRGRIWVATGRGLSYFEEGRFTSVNGLAGDAARSIAGDREGNLWIDYLNSGLLHLSSGGEVQQTPWTKLGRKDFASRLAVDPREGGLWLGFFEGGVTYLKDRQVHASYGAADGLGAGSVNDLWLDADGALWVATQGGLSRLKDGRIATLTTANGMPCDTVHWVLEDNAHSFWLYMPCGLARVPRPEVEAWVADPRHTIRPAVFDASDGVMALSRVSGYRPLAAKSSDGKLWFVTMDGIGVIDPEHLPFNKLPPPVHIERVIADRKSYAATAGATGHLQLPPLIRDLEIDYTALSLVAAEKVRFRYKLEGRDRDWQDVGTRRQAFYSDLPPRNYRFRVMACNNSGVWNEAGTFLDFAVAAAYYQTTWFRLLCVAAFLALLGALYQLRQRHVARQFNMRLEERANERTRIARDLHDTMLQSFQGVLMKFYAVTYMIQDRPEAQKKLETIVEQARQAINEGRNAVQGLRSSTVVANDLARSISSFGEELSANQTDGNRPEFRLQVEGESRDLSPIVRDEVHRIACEALRNAFQHAQAGRIEAEIRYEARQFRLLVRDNGKGIEQKVLEVGSRAGHHGLPGMQERARLAGGKLTVFSRLDNGTEIELRIPASLAYTKSPAARR
jgi:signal transduction histidine kinase/ligand-binding sensor domain-containing protein